MPERYIKQVLNGDKEVFRFIIRECREGAFSLSVSILKDEMLAKEAVQKAFIRAYERLHTFQSNSAFKTWFHRIVVNEALQILRANRKHRPFGGDLPGRQKISKSDVHELIDEDHQKFYVQETLKRMKPNESLALQLFYLEEHTIEEIGEITGWTESRIKVTLHRARKSMKTILSEIFNMNPGELYL